MQTIVDSNSNSAERNTSKPSLLRQIVDKVDNFEEGEKKLLLLKLMQDELNEKFKKLDSDIAASGGLAGEEEINSIVSSTRKEL